MNRILSSLIVLYFTVASVSAQKNETLITIGNTKISTAEFERIYKKNNSSLLNEEDKKSPADYLDLFVNFKLKVLEAEKLKMDTVTSFKNELAGYRKELAAPYLTDINYDEELVTELYNRMKKEVNASHILLTLKPNASANEEKAVLARINKIREEILAGKNFSDAAREYSEDPSAKMNGGDLGYFTVFQMVAPFEDAAFSTPVGQISEPVRSSFGYHIIKVNDIRENQGEIKVAHIMKMFPQDNPGGGREKLKAEIDSIYIALQNGADFAEMAKKYSDDKRSSAQGGELQWFSAGRMIPEFSEPAFALKNIGDYTKPVETPYGYHIIKKLDVKPVPPFEQVKKDIEDKIKKDPERSISSKKAFTDKLKNEYQYRENDENLKEIKDKSPADNSLNEKLLLFTIDNKTFRLKDFNTWWKQYNITGTYSNHFENWTEYEITNLEDSKLEEKYPEFRYLMQEYHDGILLFNISEEKIWDFAAKDTVGLEQFYQKNKGKYLWGDRFKGCIAVCNSQEIREEAENYFAAGMTPEEVEDMLNKDGKKINLKEGAWEKGSNPIVDYYVWNGPEPPYFVSEDTFIRGDKIPPEPKKLDEARGLYISDYQNYLEEKWLKELHKKYKVKVNKKLLKTIPGV